MHVQCCAFKTDASGASAFDAKMQAGGLYTYNCLKCAEIAHLCRGLAHLYEVGLHVCDRLVQQFPRVLQLPHCQASTALSVLFAVRPEVLTPPQQLPHDAESR